MQKKIYALKNGKHSGIYENWLDFYAQIKNMTDIEYAIFDYDSDYLAEEMSGFNSLEWALRQARIYLGLEEGDEGDFSEDFSDFLFPEEETDSEEMIFSKNAIKNHISAGIWSRIDDLSNDIDNHFLKADIYQFIKGDK